jgi:integrase/recombinase XerD
MSEINFLFWIRTNQLNSKGEARIYCRIQAPNKRINFSSGVSVKPEYWLQEPKRVSKLFYRHNFINEQLDRIELRLRKILYKLQDEGKPISPEIIKNEFDNKTGSKKSLFEVFQYYIDQHQARSTKRTLISYYYTGERIKQFIDFKLRRSDLFLNEVNIPFITEFENFLCNEQKLKPISANKHTQRLKTVMKFAAKLEFLPFNPLMSHQKLKEQKKEVIYLSEDELERLEEKEFTIERLSKIRDMFVFSCYTGLAYQEIKQLSKENIMKGIDGKLWLSYVRAKTLNSKGIPIKIPLMSKPLAIIQKYSIDYEAIVKNKLLPVPSNQKFNGYLKEIADLCEIEKPLTTHVARKTFATTVTLANDVPIETVAQALGHSDIKITQEYYAKVIPKKIMNDMRNLELRLEKNRLAKKESK